MRVGIDIGGMSIKVGLVNEQGGILEKGVIRPDYKAEAPKVIAGQIVTEIFRLLNKYKTVIEGGLKVGVACPGMLDVKKGIVLYSNNIEWENIPLLDYLKQYTNEQLSVNSGLFGTAEMVNVEFAIANDADAAALGEVHGGAAVGKDSAVLLTLGTGIGGGVVIDRKIFNGKLTGGCELGHMAIVYNGRKCTCGRKGCLETYASASALMKSAREVAEADRESLMNELSEHDLDKINGKTIFDAQKAGDKSAIKVVDEYEEYLAAGIANLVNIFRPEIFIIGGGVSAQGNYFTDVLYEKVKPLCFGGNIGEVPPIVTSSLGNDAGIIGAAFLVN